MRRWVLRSFFAALCHALSYAAAFAQSGPQPMLPTIVLNAGIHNIQSEVAQTPEERATGMMFRKQMGPNAGMLFVFEQRNKQCFWMQNTLLPLSIAFLADDGRVVNIADMKPQTVDPHCSDEPVRFALEVNRGWFAKRGIKAGAKLQGAPFKH